MNNDKSVRLNKHLALTLGISRREADTLIEKGKVSVNDKKAELGSRYTPGDALLVNGKSLNQKTPYRYIVFNKPVGYVCSRRAQGDAPTIYALLPKELHTLKPVGRLDKNSSGLLLLTNDGDFAHQLTHPRFYKVKRYLVTLDTALEPLHQQMISDFGVQLDDGTSKFTVTRIDDKPTYEIIMSEGRNRQIRRTFAALGYQVATLHRVQFGNYNLHDLKSGAFATTKPV